jgi:hypothetical protein
MSSHCLSAWHLWASTLLSAFLDRSGRTFHVEPAVRRYAERWLHPLQRSAEISERLLRRATRVPSKTAWNGSKNGHFIFERAGHDPLPSRKSRNQFALHSGSRMQPASAMAR